MEARVQYKRFMAMHALVVAILYTDCERMLKWIDERRSNGSVRIIRALIENNIVNSVRQRDH